MTHSRHSKVLKATDFPFKGTAGNDVNEWSRQASVLGKQQELIWAILSKTKFISRTEFVKLEEKTGPTALGRIKNQDNLRNLGYRN